MSNTKVKINKRRNRISYRFSKPKSVGYHSLYDSKRKNFFINGLGSVLNIFGSSHIQYPSIATDFEAISHDWKTVGQDIFKAKKKFERKNSKKLNSTLTK